MNSSIELKIIFLTHKVLNEQSPSYLKDLIVLHYPSRALRSHSAGLLWFLETERQSHADLFYGTTLFPATLHRIGGRALSYQTSLLWNQLPVWVRESDTLPDFKLFFLETITFRAGSGDSNAPWSCYTTSHITHLSCALFYFLYAVIACIHLVSSISPQSLLSLYLFCRPTCSVFHLIFFLFLHRSAFSCHCDRLQQTAV